MMPIMRTKFVSGLERRQLELVSELPMCHWDRAENFGTQGTVLARLQQLLEC